MASVHFSTLLIEPPGIDSQLLKVMLAPEKFRVTAIECGAEAWNLIQETDPPDLIVIDIDLPTKGAIRIDASQLLQLICHKPNWRDIPKIIFTINPNTETLQKLPKKQTGVVIAKPYDPRRFMQEVYRALTHRLEHHIREINQEHIQLTGMLRGLRAMADGIDDSSALHQKVTDVARFIEHHFALEEQFMLQHAYRELEHHCQQHDRMSRRASSLAQDIQSGQIKHTVSDFDTFQQEILKDIALDKDYITFLREIRNEVSNH